MARLAHSVPVALAVVLAGYLLLTVSTLAVWDASGLHGPTGDEPHYLVMGRGLAVDHSLEQTQPYQEAFDQDLFGTWPEGRPSPTTTHVVEGPRGLYNVHNLGLPLLISLPYLLGGVLGVRVFMILVGAAAIVIVWRLTGTWTEKTGLRGLVTGAAGLSMPLLSGSNQIYPDMPGGVLALLGVYWLLTIDRPRRPVVEAGLAGAVAFLPWLQLKFSVVAALLLVTATIFVLRRPQRGGWPGVARVAAAAGVVLAPLAVYNWWAFGAVSGPYGEGSIELSRQSAMVVAGLVLDQRQGILLQNPLFLVGVVAVGALVVRWPVRGLVVCAAIAAIVVPNGLHPNWYGGTSFAGRFGWTGAVMFLALVAMGLTLLGERSRRTLVGLVVASACLQAWFWYRLTFTDDLLLFNSGALGDLLVGDYSQLYRPVGRFVPSFFDLAWAFHYTANLLWALAVLTLLCLGFVFAARRLAPPRRRVRTGRRRATSIAATTTALALLAAGTVYVLAETTPRPREEGVSYTADQVGVNQGALDGVVTVPAGTAVPGLVVYVPYATSGGRLDVELTYRSDGRPSSVIGTYDVVQAAPAPLASMALDGTDGQWQTVTLRFDADPQDQRVPFQFRASLEPAGVRQDFAVSGLTVSPAS